MSIKIGWNLYRWPPICAILIFNFRYPQLFFFFPLFPSVVSVVLPLLCAFVFCMATLKTLKKYTIFFFLFFFFAGLGGKKSTSWVLSTPIWCQQPFTYNLYFLTLTNYWIYCNIIGILLGSIAPTNFFFFFSLLFSHWWIDAYWVSSHKVLPKSLFPPYMKESTSRMENLCVFVMKIDKNILSLDRKVSLYITY